MGKSCPENQKQRLLLINAELAKFEGKSFHAQQLFDEAIATARSNEFLQDEALGNELAAKFHLKENRITMAIAYMKKARYGYHKWGAHNKINQLREIIHSLSTVLVTDH